MDKKKHVLIGVFIGSVFLVEIYCINAPILEYCASDTFSPSCQAGEVLLVHQARYGRMKIGRCVSRDLGFLGCYFDALTWMDKECSGKATCEVRVPNHELSEQLKCLPMDFTPYLEVSSSCRQVISVPPSRCDSPFHISVISKQQYLSSDVTDRSGCGSESAPWALSAEEGQQINITLIDFYWDAENDGNKGCPLEYGYIVDGGNSEMVTICGGLRRTRHLSTSTGNIVQIVLKEDVVKDFRFLIEFHAVGCADLKPPRDSWTRREGDTITVGCHGHNSQWEVTCKDSKWSGHIGSCILETDSRAVVMNVQSAKANVPKVVTLALIGGVTAVLCCVAVTTILTYFFIRKYKNIRKREEYYMPTLTTIQRQKGDGSSGFRTIQTYRPASTAEVTQATGAGWNSMPPRWQPNGNHGNLMMTSMTGSLVGADGIYDVVATGEELQRT